jgi:hypothetical protein
MKLLVAVKTCHVLDYHFDDLTVDWLDQQNMRLKNQPARVAAIRSTWMSDKGKSLAAGTLFLDSIDLIHQNGTISAGDGAGSVDFKFFYGTRLRRLDVKPNQRPGTEKMAEPLRQPLSDEVFLTVGDNYTQNAFKLKEIIRYALAGGYTNLLVVDDDTFVYPELFGTEFRSYDYAGAKTGAFHPGSCVFLSKAAMEILIDARITSFADDVWVGDVMAKAGIPRHNIAGIRHEFGIDYQVNPYQVSKLAVALHSCTPDVMRTLWTRYTTALSALPKDTAGSKSDPTPSASQPPVSVEEKSSSYVTLPTRLEQHFTASDLKLSTTPAPQETPSTNGSVSSETGSAPTSTNSETLSSVMSET